MQLKGSDTFSVDQAGTGKTRQTRENPSLKKMEENVSDPNGTYLRTLPRKHTEGHGTVSGQTIYFSVFFRVLP
ncbi:MAG: hypothetical protein WBN90_05235, partial [Gammaproteobacteria bacterium]